MRYILIFKWIHLMLTNISSNSIFIFQCINEENITNRHNFPYLLKCTPPKKKLWILQGKQWCLNCHPHGWTFSLNPEKLQRGKLGWYFLPLEPSASAFHPDYVFVIIKISSRLDWCIFQKKIANKSVMAHTNSAGKCTLCFSVSGLIPPYNLNLAQLEHSPHLPSPCDQTKNTPTFIFDGIGEEKSRATTGI